MKFWVAVGLVMGIQCAYGSRNIDMFLRGDLYDDGPPIALVAPHISTLIIEKGTHLPNGNYSFLKAFRNLKTLTIQDTPHPICVLCCLPKSCQNFTIGPFVFTKKRKK